MSGHVALDAGQRIFASSQRGGRERSDIVHMRRRHVDVSGCTVFWCSVLRGARLRAHIDHEHLLLRELGTFWLFRERSRHRMG